MRKRVIILGATGSIGQSTLSVCEAMSDRFEVVGLAAGRNGARLAEQARRVRPTAVAMADPQALSAVRAELPPGTRTFTGTEGVVELVDQVDADFVLSAIVGAAGLPPTLRAVQLGRQIGLANKESLVVAGSLLMPLARESGSELLPVDSEHSAIFQALHSGQPREVEKIVLTASGGPFRTWDHARIKSATLEDALKHPTWKMGPKITIDSASMMNKALEVIEARHLFEIDSDRIEVLVHPESIVHSMVEFRDASVIAQLGTPDMRTPIQYALTYPHRVAGVADRLDWRQVRQLNFETPDFERFPALRMGFESARLGGSTGAVLNAANEAAVELFRLGRVTFGGVADLLERVFSDHRPIANPTLEELLAADAWARDEVHACC